MPPPGVHFHAQKLGNKKHFFLFGNLTNNKMFVNSQLYLRQI
jgi:hypothetical protein